VKPLTIRIPVDGMPANFARNRMIA